MYLKKSLIGRFEAKKCKTYRFEVKDEKVAIKIHLTNIRSILQATAKQATPPTIPHNLQPQILPAVPSPSAHHPLPRKPQNLPPNKSSQHIHLFEITFGCIRFVNILGMEEVVLVVEAKDVLFYGG